MKSSEIDLGFAAKHDFIPERPESGMMMSEDGEPVMPGVETVVYERPTEEPSFENLIRFMELSVFNGENLVGNSRRKKREPSDQSRNMASRYIFTTSTLAEIAETFECSKQNVDANVKHYVRWLSESSLNEKFPIDVFRYLKPSSRERRGGRSTTVDEIITLVQQGLAFRQLQDRGYTTKQICAARKRRKNKADNTAGINVPFGRPLNSKAYQESLLILTDPEASRNERQELLDSISIGMINQRRTKYKKKEFVFLSELFKESGISLAKGRVAILPSVIERIKASDIPASLKEYDNGRYILRYGIISACDVDAVREILDTDPFFDQFRRKAKGEEASTGSAKKY